ncbi:M48 family metalloprotease [Halosimplex sp. J119]
MASKLLRTRHRRQFDSDVSTVESSLREVLSGVSLSETHERGNSKEITGVHSRGESDDYYRWALTPEPEGGATVTELSFSPSRWRNHIALALLGLMLMCLATLMSHLVYPFVTDTQLTISGHDFVIVLVGLGAASSISGSLSLRPLFMSPPEEFLELLDIGYGVEKTERKVGWPIIALQLAFFSLMLAMIYLNDSPWWVHIAISGYSVLILVMSLVLALDVVRGTRFRLFDRATLRPVGKQIFISRTNFGLVAACAVPSMFYFVLAVLTESLMPSLFNAQLTDAIAFGYLGLCFGLMYQAYEEGSMVEQWKRDVDISNLSTPKQAVFAALTILLFYVGLVLSGALLLVVVSDSFTLETPGGIALEVGTFAASVCVLMIIYPVSATVAHAVAHVVELRAYLSSIEEYPRLSSYRPNFEWDNRTDTPVFVVSGNRTLRAVRLPRSRAIIVSTDVIGELDEDELRAVLAHEEAHHLPHSGKTLPYSDAFIRFVTPFIAVFTGLGQSVIYAIADFRRREYRADLYASDQTSNEDLLSALDTLSEDGDRGTDTSEKTTDDAGESTDDGQGLVTRDAMTSGVSAVTDPRDGSGFFHPMFSSFSVTAHPLLEERKRAIDPDRPIPEDAADVGLPKLDDR